MDTFRQLPLGQPIPDSPHAVLCSLPRLADVVGYEEGRPETVAAMRTGYPRFLTNPLVAQAQALAAQELGFRQSEVRLVATEALATGLARYVGAGASPARTWRGVWAVEVVADDTLRARAKAYLQHVGAAITSRQAEDILLAAGHLKSAHPEPVFAGDAAGQVGANLAEAFGVADASAPLLTGSGMGAFYAVFEAIRAVQRPRMRKLWLQLGWQYVDTTEVLRKFLGPDERCFYWNDVYDRAGLEAFFHRHGPDLAGVVAEFPNNPLLHTTDLPALYALCARQGAVLVVDPTLASPRVVDVLPHCDVAVNSLTKFAGNQGDVMAGAAIFNPASPFAGELRPVVAASLPAPYPRDLARLAAQIDGYAPLVARATATAARLVDFLRGHPAVREVYWTGAGRGRLNFAGLARELGAVGSVFSFSLNGDLARFYDRVRIVKGPSFGTVFTLLCPFMYLAHYDLVSTPAGRAELAVLGLDPALVRVSIGAEPAGQIEAALTEALE
jgi:cystathionine gamma-synthase